ncbi:MAG TPA: hypothetical protein VF789_19165 [Thermoanaerobaculia bacterium]
MGEQERFLVTFDSARKAAVKVERVGEAGELTEVDLPGFLRMLAPAPGTAAGAPQQITINIYGGGAPGAPVVEQMTGPPKPPPYIECDEPIPHYNKPKKEE